MQTRCQDLRLPEGLLRQVLSLNGTAAYAVSPFERSPLADGESTYIYCAAIRPPGSRDVLGGVALVFDARTEFRAMLRDACPEGQQLRAAFVDGAGREMASASDDIVVGQRVAWDAAGEPSGQAQATLSVIDGQDAIVEAASSGGYREFKRSDGYREPVRAVLVAPARRAIAGAADDRAS